MPTAANGKLAVNPKFQKELNGVCPEALCNPPLHCAAKLCWLGYTLASGRPTKREDLGLGARSLLVEQLLLDQSYLSQAGLCTLAGAIVCCLHF